MTDVTSPQAPRRQGQQQGKGRGGGAGADTARDGGAGANRARGAGASTGRGGGTRANTARPLPRGDSLYTPGASDARRRMERSSARPLVWLHQQPVWLPPLVVALLLVVGLAVPGWLGAAALVVV